jgi:hypothetical protein
MTLWCIADFAVHNIATMGIIPPDFFLTHMYKDIIACSQNNAIINTEIIAFTSIQKPEIL